MTLTSSQIQDYYSSQSASKTPLSPAQYEASLAPKPPAPVSNQTTATNGGVGSTIAPATTGANEPGANPANASTPGHDVYGAPTTPTPTAPTTGTQTTTAQGTPTTPDVGLANDPQHIRDMQREADVTAFNQSQQAIQNGAVPLSPSELAQVNGLSALWDKQIADEKQRDAQANGVANLSAARSGALEYDANVSKNIAAVASAGAAKVLNLQQQEAAAVAQLTQALRADDMKAAADAFKLQQDARDATAKGIADYNTNVQKALTAAQDQQMKVDQYNLDVAKFQQTGDQAAFDNAFKQEQQAFDEQYKTKQLALDAYKAGQGAGGGGIGQNIQSTAIAASGGPDPVSQKTTYDQIAAQYGPMTAVAIKGLANYEINPTSWSSRAAKGMTQAEAVTLAKMYDPTYNEAMYATRAGYMKNLASSSSGTVGSAVNSANKAINHLTAYATSMGQIGATPSSLTNRLLYNTAGLVIPGERSTIGAAQTEGLGVAEELAKFFKGSGTVDVASIDAWKNQLSPYSSPADVRGLTQGALTLLSGQLETLAEQYTSTMGKAPTNNFLSPSALASLSSLKNQGYDVPIQGVLYTDKNAYLANDTSAKANMATAVQQLTAAGLPLTPDNILQLAQQQ